MSTNQKETYGVVPANIHRISWGAVFAGLIGTLALVWLLLLLGSALGISLLDATDAGALGEGFGWGAVIWLLLSFLAAYFIGGAMAGRLSSDPTSAGGMLHGVTVWSTATVLSLVLGAAGLGGAAHVASHAAGDAARATAKLAADTGGAQSLEVARQLARQFADSELADEIAAAIKSRAAELLSSSVEDVGQQQTRLALSEIDAETATAVSRDLRAGNVDQAVERLAQATSLSRSQINRLIDGLQSQIETAIDDSATLDQLQAQIHTQVNNAVQAAADIAGPALTASELRAALSELDAEILAEIAARLMQGQPDRAQNVLTSNTSLSEQQVNQVVDELAAKFELQLEQWKQQAEQAIEMASNYAQMALWSVFFASLLALVAAMLGGRMGAARIRR